MAARNGESMGAPAPCARTRVGPSAGPSNRSSGSGEAAGASTGCGDLPEPPPSPGAPEPPEPPGGTLDGGIRGLYPSTCGQAAPQLLTSWRFPARGRTAMAKTTLPPEAALERSLARMVHRLREAAEDNLLGVATYGALAKSRHASGSGAAEVNILVVVANATLQALLPLAPVLTSAQRQSQVSSFVATPAELRVDAQLFPARLLEIRLTHRLLYGDVHLDRLEIAPRGLRFAALQELENLEIRLRHRILDRGTDPDLLWAGIVQSLPRLIAILETVLQAHPGERRGAGRVGGGRGGGQAPRHTAHGGEARPPAGIGRGAGGGDLIEEAAKELAEQQGARDPEDQPEQRQRRASAQDQPPHVAAGRPAGLAPRGLPRALGPPGRRAGTDAPHRPPPPGRRAQ